MSVVKPNIFFTSYSVIERLLFWLILWVGTGLIVYASSSYAIGDVGHGFLIERPRLTMLSWWRTSLYVHVAAGCLCLVASLVQYSGVLLRRAPRVHKSLGYIYVLVLLVAVIPTGFILGVVAKGGWVSQVGFHAMNLSVLVCVLLGMRAIFNKEITKHKAWMTRSFALVTSAITFRGLQVIFHQLHVPIDLIYPICVWLSIIINIWIAEYYILKTKHNKL